MIIFPLNPFRESQVFVLLNLLTLSCVFYRTLFLVRVVNPTRESKGLRVNGRPRDTQDQPRPFHSEYWGQSTAPHVLHLQCCPPHATPFSGGRCGSSPLLVEWWVDERSSLESNPLHVIGSSIPHRAGRNACVRSRRFQNWVERRTNSPERVSIR